MEVEDPFSNERGFTIASTVVDWEMVSPIWQPKLILSFEIVARPEPTGWMDRWIAQGHPSNDKDDGLIKTVLVH